MNGLHDWNSIKHNSLHRNEKLSLQYFNFGQPDRLIHSKINGSYTWLTASSTTTGGQGILGHYFHERQHSVCQINYFTDFKKQWDKSRISVEHTVEVGNFVSVTDCQMNNSHQLYTLNRLILLQPLHSSLVDQQLGMGTQPLLLKCHRMLATNGSTVSRTFQRLAWI